MRGKPTTQPLAGRLIVITRRREQGKRLRAELERKGARVVELPTIAVAPPRNWAPLDAAIRRLSDYDWVMFTSTNGVENFFARLRQQKKNAGALRRARIAAIGPATAAALKRYGVRADVIPDEFRAEGLLSALRRERWRGKRVLLARAATARPLLPQELRQRGARVDVVEAYRTMLPRASRKRARKLFVGRKPDAITFTSSSTVKNFFSLLGAQQARRALTGVAVVTIGPITSQTVRDLGLPVAMEAETYTVPGLVRALHKYFRSTVPRA